MASEDDGGAGDSREGDMGAEVIRIAAERAGREPAGGGGPTDVDGINAEFAVVAIGSKVMILREAPDSPDPAGRVRLMSVEAFREWLRPRRIWKEDKEGNTKQVPAATAWLSDANRRSYDGVVFEPGDDADAGKAYNLWQGFSVAPDPTGDPEPWIEHVRENVCGGSEDLFAWVAGWFAHMLQRPRERIGTALALRGGQGVGKTIVGRIVGRLVDAHYLLVDDPRYLMGQFNAHLAQTLFLQADEAFWSGDKAQVGHLKGLITSDLQMIEHKGVDPIRVRNYVRLLVTSNEDWVVPAGRDERRWAVVDVKDSRRQDQDYFGRLARHFASQKHLGGLLHYLLSLPLGDLPLRNIPKTSGLMEQKIRSLDVHESWWMERLQEGAQLPGEGEWRESVERHRLYSAYIAECERVGQRRRLTSAEFGIALKRLVPGLKTAQPRMTVDEGYGVESKRVRVYVFPPLSACRSWFEASVGQTVEWEPPPGG